MAIGAPSEAVVRTVVAEFKFAREVVRETVFI